MSRKTMLAAISAALTVLTMQPAQADWTGTGIVQMIQYSRDSAAFPNVMVIVDGITCPAGVNRFVIRDSDTNAEDMDGMLRLLIASKLSDLPVRLGYSISADPAATSQPTECSIWGVRF